MRIHGPNLDCLCCLNLPIDLHIVHRHTRTTTNQGGSGRGSYAAAQGSNRGVYLTNKIKNSHTISVCCKRHSSVPRTHNSSVTQPTTYPPILILELPHTLLLQ